MVTICPRQQRLAFVDIRDIDWLSKLQDWSKYNSIIIDSIVFLTLTHYSFVRWLMPLLVVEWYRLPLELQPSCSLS